MSEFGQNKIPVVSDSGVVDSGVCSKRFPKKRKRQTSTSSSASSPKFKSTRISHPTDEIPSGYSVSDNRTNPLASTQTWRELLSIIDVRSASLIKSEEIFKGNVNVLLNGIDECARNPAQWSKEDTKFFFDRIVSFVDSWKNQLLKEYNDKKVSVNLEKKRYLITDRLNLLTYVYQELSALMKFTASQTKIIDSRVKKLNNVISTFQEKWRQSCSTTLYKNKDHELNEARKQADECREELRKTQNSLKEAHSKLNESALATELLKNKDHELNEARKQADECREELRKLQNSLKAAHLKPNESSLATELLKNKDHDLNEARKQADECREELIRTQKSLKEAHLKLTDLTPTNNSPTQVDPQGTLDGCLQDKEKQLNEMKKLLDWGAKKQKETEGELAETREQLQSFVAKSREMTKTKQKDTIKKLSEIQTLLLMTYPNYRSSCQMENESLNKKEEKIFQDIIALIEYTMQSVGSANNCKRNTTESALETYSGSASLRVSEYEIHLVTQIAAYLKVTPFQVSSHSIYFYVANIDNIVNLQFVESLLRKFPSIFKEVAVAPGSMDKNWIYLDLKPVITI